MTFVPLGMMLEMESIDVEDLLEFCNTIIDNIQQVTGVNAFKIVQRIKLKEEGSGYDPYLFFHCMEYAIVQRFKEGTLPQADLNRYIRMLYTTCKYHREFNMTGIKKDATLDMWVLEMREC